MPDVSLPCFSQHFVLKPWSYLITVEGFESSQREPERQKMNPPQVPTRKIFYGVWLQRNVVILRLNLSYDLQTPNIASPGPWPAPNSIPFTFCNFQFALLRFSICLY
jgi:hypothetical protein